MTKKEIYKRLESYRTDKAGLNGCKQAAERLDLEIDALMRVDGYKAIKLSLTPPSKTNKINSTVEDEVERRSAKWSELDSMKESLKEINQEIRELQQRVDTVENWLAALTDEERYVIEHRYFRGNDWGYIVDEFAKDFKKEWVSDRTIYRRNGTALQKIMMICKKTRVSVICQ